MVLTHHEGLIFSTEHLFMTSPGGQFTCHLLPQLTHRHARRYAVRVEEDVGDDPVACERHVGGIHRRLENSFSERYVFKHKQPPTVPF